MNLMKRFVSGGSVRKYSDILKPSIIPSHQEQFEEQQKRNADAGVLTELVRDFIDPSAFFKALQNIGINFYTGVPDSLLKDFCAYVSENISSSNHVIAANEGAAIGIATGYHLATGKPSLVYMQNSGLGNAVNPLVSLCAPEVYSIPILLLIGWRGEPGKRDEPQHRVQGHVTPGLLAALGIPFQPLPDYIEGAEQALYTAKKHLERTGTPYGLLVKRQTFTPYQLTKGKSTPSSLMSREEAIQVILHAVNQKDILVATTGMLSRELFELRKRRGEGHEKDFLTVGSMGHASGIAFGISLHKGNRRVICLDGDGALIMHMGNIATIAQHCPPNFVHIILNNESHDSVGGQPTATQNSNLSITGIGRAVGYSHSWKCESEDEVMSIFKKIENIDGPHMIEIKIRKGSRKDLGRPTRTPIQNKTDFMHYLAINTN